jgi:hypothetical protein
MSPQTGSKIFFAFFEKYRSRKRGDSMLSQSYEVLTVKLDPIAPIGTTFAPQCILTLTAP